MGKKSKKQQSGGAKAKNAAAGPSSLTEASPEVIGSSVQTRTGSRKLKCVRCLGNLKDLAKAHQCPGCSDLYCWRCEKKQFEQCPNGANCTHPIRRCKSCSHGGTAVQALDPSTWSRNIFLMSDGRTRFENGDYLALEEAIVDGVLTVDAAPFRCCQDDCGRFQCYRCSTSPQKKDISDIFSCVVCAKARCGKCIVEKSEMLLQLEGHFYEKRGDEAALSVSAKFSDTITACRACKKKFCFECLGPLIRTIFDNGATSFLQTRDPLCKGCYWSRKPCTNPNCPNGIGVLTKRCGGCHIDRYCSVECQAAVYPDHAARCKMIQAKRLLAEKDEHEGSISRTLTRGTHVHR